MNPSANDQFLSDTAISSYGANGHQGMFQPHSNQVHSPAMSNIGSPPSQPPFMQPSLDPGFDLDAEIQTTDFTDILTDIISDMGETTNEVMLDMYAADPNSRYLNQWEKIEKLMINGSAVIKNEIERIWTQVNDPLFNLSFRRYFANVIEGMRWDLFNSHDRNPSNSTIVTALAGRLHNEVQHVLKGYDSCPGNDNQEFRYLLKRWYDRLADPYANQTAIIEGIKNVLEREKAIIEHSQRAESAVAQMPNLSVVPDDHLARISELASELEQLERVYQQGAGLIERIHSNVQELQLNLSGQLRFVDHFDTREFSRQQQTAFSNILAKRNQVVQEIQNVLSICHLAKKDQLQSILSRVLDNEVREFQRNQAYINNGKMLTHYCTIQQLQDWCKRLAMISKGNLQQMAKLHFCAEQLGQSQPTDAHQYIEELTKIYSHMIEELVRKGLIVDKHPPQVLMKDKRFQSTLRHLVGDALDIHQLNFHVKVCLVNAEQATIVMRNGPTAAFRESGKIVNNEAPSDYIPHTEVLSVNMRNMCLRMQQRGSQRAAEMVAELKFAMLYRAEITVRYPTHQTTVVAQALSLPIVVISHGKQEADAQATIFWDNAFAQINRSPFEVDDSVLWSDMLEALDGRWKKECDEGATGSGKAVGLTKAARIYLTMKLFNHRDVSPDTKITWRKFNHDRMVAGGNNSTRELFTFWTWFFKAMELCSSQYIRRYWNNGYILGFLSKSDCHNLLLEAAARGHQSGIFLFRFSETKLGSISISCTDVDENGCIQVKNLEPDAIKSFQVRSLPDMLKDLDYLTYLYPDKPKHEAFGGFYTTSAPISSDSDYIKKEFKVATVNSNFSRLSLSENPPDTPIAVMPRSPHSIQAGGGKPVKREYSETGFGFEG